MTHIRLEHQLSAYLDNELTGEEVAEVRAHLAECTICQEELERLHGLKRLLGALPEHEPSHELWASLRDQLAQPPAPVWGKWMEAARALVRRPAMAAVAFAVVVVLIAVPLVRGQRDRLRAAETGVDVYVREHALFSAADPLVDRAYLGLVIGDSNLALVGEPRRLGEER